MVRPSATSAWRTVVVVAMAASAISACGGRPKLRADAATDAPNPPAPPRTASCIDDARTWTATVSDDAAAATVTIDRLDAPSPSDGSTAWLVVTTEPDSRARVEHVLRPENDLPVELRRADAPRLVSPDRRCTIYLVPPGAPSRMSLVVVGDSLAAGLVATADERAQFGGEASDRGLRLVVDGQSGAPWTPLPDEGANLEDELRGARSFADDTTLAVVLGANDAILAALAPEPDKDEQRRRTDEVIATFVDGARRHGRCVVLTTPPDQPVEAFDLGEAYASEARRVGDVLRAYAQDPGVVVVDFAELSRDHHLPAGTAGDWFDDGDELHPNTEGHVALRRALLDAAERCRAVNALPGRRAPASGPAGGGG